MAEHSVDHFLFEDSFSKPVLAVFDSLQRSSDAGATLLGALDRRLGLTASMASCLDDRRCTYRVVHGVVELLRQRVYSIALGYADANDSHRVRHDPALQLACGRRSDDERGLGSQPTISRFEHSATGRELVKMERTLEDFVVQRLHRKHPRARRIFIDLDPTVDPTHGQQPFAFFNGHYDTWCYLPMIGFVSVEGDPEQHLFHARLRAGVAKEAKGTILVLRRIVAKLRRVYRKCRICVRLDAGFAYPQIFELLDELRVEYMVAMGENTVLADLADRHMHAASVLTRAFDQTTTLYGHGEYQSRSWSRLRRAIFKAEVVHAEGKSDRRNARFVITNLRQSAESVWRLYCKRGDSENRIKELKLDLEMDRTSCTRFLPNQLRVTMTAIAMVLFQELRTLLRDTELHRASVATMRLRLLKVGATIKESVRRIVVSMSVHHAWKDLWRLVAERATAVA